MRFHYKNEIYEKEGENWPMKNILLQYVFFISKSNFMTMTKLPSEQKII